MHQTVLLYLLLNLSFGKVQVLHAQDLRWRQDSLKVSGAYVPVMKQDIGFENKQGQFVRKDLTFLDETGKEVRIADYFGRKKPTILVFAYPSCKLLCHYVLDGLTAGLKQMGQDWYPSKQFQILTIDLTPNESVEILQNQKEKYISKLGISAAASGWHFLVGKEENIQALAQSAGFKYKWDEATQQYSHAAGVIFLDENGKVSNVVQNIKFEGNVIKKAIIDASEGRVGNFVEQAFLWCYHFDPNENSYTFQAYRFGTLLAGGLGLVMLSVLGFLWFTEFKKSKSKKTV